MCVLFAPLTFSIKAAADQTPEIAYSRDPDTVVFLYDIDPGELAESQSEPLLRIYGDGRVHLHYPPYSKQAGDYELYLSDEEMQRLLNDVSNIIGLDIATVKQQLAGESLQIQQESGLVFAVSDETLTRFEIQLDGFKAAANKIARTVRKTIVWANLGSEAKRFPTNRALQDLAAANRKVRELISQLHARDDLVKLNDPAEQRNHAEGKGALQ